MAKARQVYIDAPGDPLNMQLRTVDLPLPEAGEVQLRQTAIGFNYIDVYQRSGKYALPLPSGLGHEAAGVVEAVGEGVTQFKPKDRVVYMNAGLGAYADRRNVAAEKLVALPADVSDEDAVAVFFKGMTAQYLLRKTYRVKPGDVVIVHAAAGGVGQILSRWARGLGAHVFGTAGSSEKCRIAQNAGCEACIDYSNSSWVSELLRVMDGRKANVVYDSVARHTFMGSLDCAAPFSTVVLFGAASGPAPNIDPELLNKKGCLFLTRPSVFPHNAVPATFRENAQEVFTAIREGLIQPHIGATFSLDQVVDAHIAAESRATSGAIVLIP
jgi:NADPH2:quinone reductase